MKANTRKKRKKRKRPDEVKGMITEINKRDGREKENNRK